MYMECDAQNSFASLAPYDDDDLDDDLDENERSLDDDIDTSWGDTVLACDIESEAGLGYRDIPCISFDLYELHDELDDIDELESDLAIHRKLNIDFFVCFLLPSSYLVLIQLLCFDALSCEFPSGGPSYEARFAPVPSKQTEKLMAFSEKIINISSNVHYIKSFKAILTFTFIHVCLCQEYCRVVVSDVQRDLIV